MFFIVSRATAGKVHFQFVYVLTCRMHVQCNTCGYYGVHKFSLLAHECQPTRATGKANLSAIENGLMPNGVLQWHDEASHAIRLGA